MAQRSFPFDTDPNTQEPQQVFEEDFSELLFSAVPDGVLEGLSHSVNQRDVIIGSGRAALRGYGYVNDDFEEFEVPLNSSSDYRLDRIVVRLDRANNEALLSYKEGIPGPRSSGPFGNQPDPPSLNRSTNVWEIPLLRILVNPNNSSLFEVRREETSQLIAQSSFATQRHLEDYLNGSYSEGMIGYIREEGEENGNYPRFGAIRNETFTELRSVGPWRQFRKQGNRTFTADGVYRPLTGWTTVHGDHKPFGNEGVQLSGNDIILHYSGLWDIRMSLAWSADGGEGAAHARIRNTNTGESIWAHRWHGGSRRVSADVSDFMYANAGDTVRVEVYRTDDSGGSGIGRILGGWRTRINFKLECGDIG